MDVGNIALGPVARRRAAAAGLAASLAATALGIGPAAPFGGPANAAGSAVTVGTGSNAEYVLARAPTSVLISTKSATVTSGGDAPIALVCPAGAPGTCRGTVAIGLAGRTRRGRASRSLGSATYEAPSGRAARVRIRLNAYGRRRLVRRKALRVTATATTVWDGHTATTACSIVLKRHTRH
jgi:hypothetical protein